MARRDEPERPGPAHRGCHRLRLGGHRGGPREDGLGGHRPTEQVTSIDVIESPLLELLLRGQRDNPSDVGGLVIAAETSWVPPPRSPTWRRTARPISSPSPLPTPPTGAS